MRGRPSPLSSVALAAVLLVPVAIGGMVTGVGSPYHAGPPSETFVTYAAPSHSLSPPGADADADTYGDVVVTYTPGDDGAAAGRTTRALGAPDGYTLGLGDGGCIILTFDDLVIQNDAFHGNADLIVYETRTSADEYAFLDVSANGIDYLRWGLLDGGTDAVDLSALEIDQVRFLRITDTGANHYTSNQRSGFDLDAVRALQYTTVSEQTAGHVQSLTQGAIQDSGLRHACA